MSLSYILVVTNLLYTFLLYGIYGYKFRLHSTVSLACHSKWDTPNTLCTPKPGYLTIDVVKRAAAQEDTTLPAADAPKDYDDRDAAQSYGQYSYDH